MLTEELRRTYEFILPELYREIRYRRDHVFAVVTRIGAFCALAIGWALTSNLAFHTFERLICIVVISLFALIAIRSLRSYIRQYNSTSRVIVQISKEFGLFDGIYPAQWKKWGIRYTCYEYIVTVVGL